MFVWFVLQDLIALCKGEKNAVSVIISVKCKCFNHIKQQALQIKLFTIGYKITNTQKTMMKSICNFMCLTFTFVHICIL